MNEDICMILCKLEQIYPPAFFDIMIHFSIHLPNEALLGGPAQFRWMYPIETSLCGLKRSVRNKAHPEGSIAEVLCDWFASPKYKHISDVNKGNRKKLRCKHISGRKAFTVRRHEISQKELNGEVCDIIELYKRTHCTETGAWRADEAEKYWELMVKKREEYRTEGIEKTDDEIVLDVLGHGSGYVKGLGYGPKPPSRRNTSVDSTSQQLQKELQETQEKLQQSETQVNDLKTQVTGFENEVTGLKDQLSQHSATVNKLMAYLASTGVQL